MNRLVMNLDSHIHEYSFRIGIWIFTRVSLVYIKSDGRGRLSYVSRPDNFAHVGGFLAGLVMAVIVMPTAYTTSRTRRVFLWIMRLVAFVLLIVACYLLLDAFYKGKSPQEVSNTRLLYAFTDHKSTGMLMVQVSSVSSCW